MKVKIEHSVISDGVNYFTTDSLTDAKKFAFDLQNRRTGKSYKKLFEALSSNGGMIFLIYKNRSVAQYHIKTFENILKDLDFKYKVFKNQNMIHNLDRRFYFLTEEEYNSYRFVVLEGTKIYDL